MCHLSRNLLRLLSLQKLDGMFSKMQKASQKKSKKGKLKDLNMGKLPPKEGVLLQHYLRSVVQARIHEATNARMNHVDPQEYGWKPSDEGFIPITTEDNKVPKLLCVDATQPTTQRDRAKMLLEWYPLLESV